MATNRPRVLVLDEEVPHPLNTGKKIRTFNLLIHLAREFEIDMIVHRDGATKEALAALESAGIRIHVAPSGIPRKKGLGFLVRLFLNLFSGRPYSVASHARAPYKAKLEALMRAGEYSLVHCEWTPYASYTLGLRQPWIVAAHNVESQIWKRMAGQERSWPRRLFIREQARKMRAFERRVFAEIPGAIAVSDADGAWIREAGCREVVVVPNGVDAEAFRPVEIESDSTEPSLVFTGALDWRPNQDAVRWFLETLHPLLEVEGPYSLKIVGRNPPEWMRSACEHVSEIELVGPVPDVRPYVAEGNVFIVPLRIGGGSRLKILEAFAMGRAVVSTSVGAEGLDVTHDRHILIEDEPAMFVAAVRGLLRDPQRRMRLGAQGRELVERHYDWPIISKAQARAWRRFGSS